MPHDDQHLTRFHDIKTFGMLAREVVAVLNARQAQPSNQRARPYVRSLLDRRLTSKTAFNPADTLDELRALRLSDAAIVDQCIPDAACAIGAKWANDELGFAEVTIASVRLQSLLTEVEFLRPAEPPGFDCDMDVLMLALEGEQHTLGCFVTAAGLRRRGAAVETLCGAPDAVILDHLARNTYDAVLISCSRLQDLPAIARLVERGRRDSGGAPLFMLGGIVLGADVHIRQATGVDLVTNDLDVVVSYCKQRSTRPLKQASR